MSDSSNVLPAVSVVSTPEVELKVSRVDPGMEDGRNVVFSTADDVLSTESVETGLAGAVVVSSLAPASVLLKLVSV